MLILLHLLFNGQQLALQLGAQSWQSVSDVIGQLLMTSDPQKEEVLISTNEITPCPHTDIRG